MRTLKDNIEKLEEIRKLKPNWNDEGADAISSTIVDNAITIIRQLNKQPFVAPTSDGTIFLEYDIDLKEVSNFEESRLLDSQGLILEVFEDKVGVSYMQSLNDCEE